MQEREQTSVEKTFKFQRWHILTQSSNNPVGNWSWWTLDQENFVLITGDTAIQYESVRAHRKLNPWIVELGQPFDLS